MTRLAADTSSEKGFATAEGVARSSSRSPGQMAGNTEPASDRGRSCCPQERWTGAEVGPET